MPGDMLDIVVIPIKIVPVEHVAVLYSSISYGIYRFKPEAWEAARRGGWVKIPGPSHTLLWAWGVRESLSGTCKRRPKSTIGIAMNDEQ
jgi:hypothetical protein